jgi:pimeloyl-ACP methyl ester carboxylesterase
VTAMPDNVADYLEVPTPDDRILEVLTEGDPDGYPLVYHVGTPTAAVHFPLLDRAARAAGLRVVSYSRPGYGGSTPWPYSERGPRIADDVVDVLAVLHHLGIDEFVTLGWSGGGPRALACAALLPGRCRAAASFAGVAPYGAEGLDWDARKAEENVEEFAAAIRGAAAYHLFLRALPAPEGERTPQELVDGLGGLLTPVDAAFLTGEFATYLDQFGRRARAQGVVGWRDDGLAVVGDWGFDVRAITVPVSVWHGRQDAMVPFDHGEWLAAHIPGAHAHLYDDAGHLSLWSHVDEVLADLRQLAGL